MPRQQLPVTTVPTSYASDLTTALVDGNPVQITIGVTMPILWTAEDASNHSQFAATGREELEARNTDTGSNDTKDLATAGGTVTLGNAILTITLNGVAYIATVPYNSTTTQVQAAIRAAVNAAGATLNSRYPGAVACSGTSLPAGTVSIAFSGALGGQAIDSITVDNAGLTGGTFGVTDTTPGTGGHLVQVKSTKDPNLGRVGDAIVVVGAGRSVVFPFFNHPLGWAISGQIDVDADSALVEFAVKQLPTS